MMRFQEAVGDGALPFGVQATENVLTLGRRPHHRVGARRPDARGRGRRRRRSSRSGEGRSSPAARSVCSRRWRFGRARRPRPRVWATQAEGCAPARPGVERACGSELPPVTERLADAEARAARAHDALDRPVTARPPASSTTSPTTGSASPGRCIETGGGSIVSTEDEIVGGQPTRCHRRRLRRRPHRHVGVRRRYLAGVRQGVIDPDDDAVAVPWSPGCVASRSRLHASRQRAGECTMPPMMRGAAAVGRRRDCSTQMPPIPRRFADVLAFYTSVRGSTPSRLRRTRPVRRS